MPLWARPQQIAEQMNAFVETGCDYFMIDIIGAPDEPEPSLACSPKK